ncbi:hypothetical protein CIB54_16795 [Pseudomonas fluorescens]|uniref:Uncharacterized protein n=1 Tax=Pseudomonas fluorescens TaxID=294 RepID=A0A2N1E3D7_PSEFL|nr:hypothetical protein CIB54_16795 [Pseudomonas fluorescens]
MRLGLLVWWIHHQGMEDCCEQGRREAESDYSLLFITGSNRPIAAGCDRQQWPNLSRALRRQHIFEIGIRIMPIHSRLDI